MNRDPKRRKDPKFLIMSQLLMAWLLMPWYLGKERDRKIYPVAEKGPQAYTMTGT